MRFLILAQMSFQNDSIVGYVLWGVDPSAGSCVCQLCHGLSSAYRQRERGVQ